MPVDTSIYGNIQPIDALGNYERGMRIKDMADERAAAQAAAQAQAQKQQQMDQAYNQSLEGSQFAGLGSQGFKAKNEVEGSAIKKQESMMSQAVNNAKFGAQILGAAQSQDDWNAGLERLGSLGMDVSKLPQQFSPGAQKFLMDQAMSLQDRLAKEQSDKNSGFQKEQFNYTKEKDARDFKLRERELEAKRMADQAKADKEPSSKGIEAADKAYGKDFVKYSATGRNNAVNTIEKLKKLQLEVAADTGFGEAGGTRFSKIIPDFARSSTAIERRDDARNFANKTLKELFGGQLSDGEREAAAKEFWNDNLDNKSNAARLAGKIKELEDNVKAQDAQAEYFRKNKTLDGFAISPIDNPEIGDKYATQGNPAPFGVPGVGEANAGRGTVLRGNQIDWAD